mgnify:CR=1 FL=1
MEEGAWNSNYESVKGREAAIGELLEACPEAGAARAVWAETALVFLASELPVLPTGDVYQLWFVTPGDPVSGGFLTPDAEGSLRAMVNIPDSVTMPTAMAITLEPAGGVRAPTGEVYLLGQPVTL